jgi:hypothetical protein
VRTAPFLVFLGVLIAFAIPAASAYEIDGDYVIEEDSNIYISAYPHTLTLPDQEAYFTIISKKFTGEIDLVFGFDMETIRPKSAEFYKDGEWIDISERFNSLVRDYQGFDKWYYLKNVTVQEDEEYYMKVRMKTFSSTEGKYWVCMKRTQDTFQEAIGAGTLYCLDPWFSITYAFRQEITGYIGNLNGTSVTTLVPLNLTFNNSNEIIACNMTYTNTQGNSIGFIYYNNYTDYVCTDRDQSTSVTRIIDEGNGTDFGTIDSNITMWYTLNNCGTGNTCIDIADGNNLSSDTSNPAAINAQVGTGIYFDGDDCKYSGNLDIDYGTGNITIAYWFNTTDIVADNAVIFHSKAANSEFFVYMARDGAATIDFRVTNTTSSLHEIRSNNLGYDDNTWHFAVATYDTIQQCIYYDGAQDKCEAAAGLGQINPTGPMILGCASTVGADAWTGSLDDVRIYNRLLSDDEILAIYNAGIGNYTAGAEEPREEVSVIITSPVNITYLTTNIPLQFTLNDCDDSLYSLNGAANVTTSCSNVTLDANIGNNIVEVYANDSTGDLFYDTVSFTVIGSNYTVSIFDEMTGEAFNTSDQTLTAFCQNETLTFTVNGSTDTPFEITCTLLSMRLTVIDNDSNTHSRVLRPTVVNGTLNYYMINQTKDTSVNQKWNIFDITGVYENGIVRISKVIGSIGQQIITEEIIDAEGKVVVDLIVGEVYIVSIFDSNLENERNIGFIEADASTEITMEVSNIPFATDSRTTARDVNITFGWDTASQLIRGIYNDSLAQTTSVNFLVVNASNTSQVMFNQTSTSNSVTFTFNNVNVNSTYIATFTIEHETYGQLLESKTIDFSETGRIDIGGLDNLGLGIWKAVAAGLIITFAMLGFGRKNSKAGTAVGALLMIFFLYAGWFSEAPQLTWGIMTLIAFMAFISMLSIRRQLQ